MPAPHTRIHTAEWLLWRVVAYSVAYLYVAVLPSLIKPHWASILALFGGPKGLFTVGTGVIHLGTALVCNTGFAVLYASKIGFFDRFKTNPKPWPWEQSAAKRAEIFGLIRLGIALTLLNNLIGVALAFGNYDILVARGATSSLDTWPSTWTIAWQLAAFQITEDTVFYACHRLLHSSKFLYTHVHKLHHKYHYTISIASECTHPVEYILGNGLPFLAGPLLVGDVHSVTLLLWLIERVIETNDGHSGYDFPWMPQRILPLASSAADHDAHHSLNTGNYGSFSRVWDVVFGTQISDESLEKAIYGAAPAAAVTAAAAAGVKQE